MSQQIAALLLGALVAIPVLGIIAFLFFGVDPTVTGDITVSVAYIIVPIAAVLMIVGAFFGR